MEKLLIYKFQAEEIKEALRIVSNLLNSSTKETCMDRDIMQAKEYIENVLNRDIDKKTNRL